MSVAITPSATKTTGRVRTPNRTLEHRFYLGFALLLAAAVGLGFARTFFLRHWFPEWAAAHAGPEPFFILHGLVFTAWLAALILQIALVGRGQVSLHRRLGWLGAGLSVAVVIVGVWASLIAAHRPTGFVDVPMPPLTFLVVPLGLVLLFAVFVTLAILRRREAQSHKRLMLLAGVSLIEAAVGRWPIEFLRTGTLLPFLSPIDLAVDLFLLPLLLWDLYSRGRIHSVTLWGGLALILIHPIRFVLAETTVWQDFARWSVQLLAQ